MAASQRPERKYYLPVGLPAPAPHIDGLGKEFWEATRRHELLVQFCGACENYQWGPEFLCHHCHDWDSLSYRRVEPRGRIYSWERNWYPAHPALQTGVPYLVVLVELPGAGNVRMVGNLLGDPEQEVVIGTDVEAVFEDHDDHDPQFTLVQWRVV
ncbi:MAG: DNA-binding protein [Chloroflexi bacterium]|nr:DNA-binding protein [Chloroflexota bacterium]